MKISTSFLYFIILLLLCPKITQGQEREGYELLWEIQHKNSSKKSYLFGTMHIKDERAFKFSDAVIPAIKNSEAFALEIHPDSISSSLEDGLLNRKLENSYKRVLSKEEYKLLSDRFFEVNNIHIDSFPLQHPMMIESMLIKETEKETDKRTFLDAYLFGIANNFEKEILGLEKVEDQLPLIEAISDEEIRDNVMGILKSDDEENNAYLEDLITLYYEGNIGRILFYTSGFRAIDKVMKSRNQVMVNKLVSTMENKSIFAAVGAAHLPGSYGIIELLRERGFEVRKVEATFNNKQGDYKIIPNLNRWFKNNVDSLGYSVFTPARAIPIEVVNGIDTMTAMDLVSGGTFAYMAIDLRPYQLKEDYDYISGVIENQLDKENEVLLSNKSFIKDGVEFTEILIQDEEKVMRMQIAFTNKILYSFFIENSIDEINSEYSNSFFDSIKVYDPKAPSTAWEQKTDTIGAYAIDLPGKISDLSRVTPNPSGDTLAPYELNIFSAKDPNKKILYLLRYNDQPVGTYINDTEAYFDYFKDYFEERGTIITEPEPINVEGNKGKDYELLFSNKYHARARLIIRGNRSYLLLAQKLVENDTVPLDNEVFKSFKLKPFNSTVFDTVVSINDNYSFRIPSKKLKIDIIDDIEVDSYFGDSQNYSTLDTNTGGTYVVEYLKVKPYFKKESLDSFYKEYAELLTGYNDTILSNTESVLGGKPSREIIMENKETQLTQRMNLLYHDGNVFLLLAYLGDEEIMDNRSDSFFNSFTINRKKEVFNLSESKAKLIFEDLKSSDSLTFENAKGAFSYHIFDPKDFKILKTNLDIDFKDKNEENGVKEKIIRDLSTLDKKGTLDLLSDFYLSPKSTHHSRRTVLEELLELSDSNASNIYFDLLENHKPLRDSNTNFNVFNSLRDSIPLFIERIETIASLIDHDDYRDEIVGIYSTYIAGNTDYSDRITPIKKRILSNVYNDAKLYTDSLSRATKAHINYGLINDYIDLIATSDELDSEEIKTLKLLSEQTETKSWLKTRAIITSVEKNVTIKGEILAETFSNLYTRFELMEAFNKSNKKDQIPAKYITIEEFAKLSLYNEVGDSGDYPDFLNLLGTVVIDDAQYLAYSFGYSADQDVLYLGLSDAQAPNFSDLKMNTSYFDWQEISTDWRNQAQQLIKSSLENGQE